MQHRAAEAVDGARIFAVQRQMYFPRLAGSSRLRCVSPSHPRRMPITSQSFSVPRYTTLLITELRSGNVSASGQDANSSSAIDHFMPEVGCRLIPARQVRLVGLHVDLRVSSCRSMLAAGVRADVSSSRTSRALGRHHLNLRGDPRAAAFRPPLAPGVRAPATVKRPERVERGQLRSRSRMSLPEQPFVAAPALPRRAARAQLRWHASRRRSCLQLGSPPRALASAASPARGQGKTRTSSCRQLRRPAGWSALRCVFSIGSQSPAPGAETPSACGRSRIAESSCGFDPGRVRAQVDQIFRSLIRRPASRGSCARLLAAPAWRRGRPTG